jgi:hypothetical protein
MTHKLLHDTIACKLPGNVFVPLDHCVVKPGKEAIGTQRLAIDHEFDPSHKFASAFFLDTYCSILQNSCEAPVPRREKTNLGVGRGRSPALMRQSPRPLNAAINNKWTDTNVIMCWNAKRNLIR